AIAGRDLVLLDHLFGDRLIVGEDLLVAAAHEAALRRRVDDLARGRAFAGVGGRGRDVLRAALQLRRFTLQVRVVAAAVLLAALAGALPGLVPFLTRAGPRSLGGDGHTLSPATGSEHEPLAALAGSFPVLALAFALTLPLLALSVALLAARALTEVAQLLEPLLAPLALLAEQLAHLFELLQKLPLLLIGHLL